MDLAQFLEWVNGPRTEAEFIAQITLMGQTAPAAGSPLDDFRNVLRVHGAAQPATWTVPAGQIPPGWTPPAATPLPAPTTPTAVPPATPAPTPVAAPAATAAGAAAAPPVPPVPPWRRWIVPAAIVVVVLAAALMAIFALAGGDEDGGLVVTKVTPTGTATAPATATGTPTPTPPATATAGAATVSQQGPGGYSPQNGGTISGSNVYGQPPQAYLPHPTYYVETGTVNSRQWSIQVDSDKVLIVGGVSVNGQGGGVYKAYPGGQTVNVSVANGFASVVTNNWYQNEWCFRLGQAIQYGWAHGTEDPLPGTKACN